MLPGYNHNIQYKGRVFHVQTEDSGVKNPHIITHLFVGGNVIESRKVTYDDRVGTADLKSVVVALMQAQHKAVLKDLIRGDLDQRIQQRAVGAGTLDGPAPLNVAAGQQRASTGPAGAGRPIAAASATPTATPPATTEQPPSPPERRETRPTHEARPAMRPTSGRVDRVFMAPPPAAVPPAVAAKSKPPREQPAPARVIAAETLEAAFESPNEAALDSIFGEDLISEKSLDEVILSFLADDLTKR